MLRHSRGSKGDDGRDTRRGERGVSGCYVAEKRTIWKAMFCCRTRRTEAAMLDMLVGYWHHVEGRTWSMFDGTRPVMKE